MTGPSTAPNIEVFYDCERQIDLGEGALAISHDDGTSFGFVDLSLGNIYLFESGEVISLRRGRNNLIASRDPNGIPSMIGTIAQGSERNELIVACDRGIYSLNTLSLKLKLICHPEADREALGVRYNDGKISPDGFLIVGSMYKSPELRDQNPDSGHLWAINTLTGNSSIIASDLNIPNGLVWEVGNENFFYHIDTPTRSIVRYRYQPGVLELEKPPFISDPTVIATIEERAGLPSWPDGMTVSSTGIAVVGLYEGKGLWLVDLKNPENQKIIDLPVRQVTNAVFIDDTLYVTTADEGMKYKEQGLEPQAGNVFRLKINGLSAPQYSVAGVSTMSYPSNPRFYG